MAFIKVPTSLIHVHGKHEIPEKKENELEKEIEQAKLSSNDAGGLPPAAKRLHHHHLTAPPQASVDDSSCDSETRELNLSNTKNLNEDSKLENKHRESDLELDLTAPLQASVDDSEKPELSLSAFADEVCQNPVSMDSEMNVASEGEPHEDDDDDGKVANQGHCEEFDTDLNQKAGDAFSGESGSDCSVVVDQSEAQVELEFAKQGRWIFRDFSSLIDV